ncbi:MAG: hypothetical protein MJE68_03160 [Proteobacteria bacterium]|nr:hypothetical protein [Pseudomonadota bacterium]
MSHASRPVSHASRPASILACVCVCVCLACAVLSPSPTHAQDLTQNITVHADHELEWRRDTRQYFARGNATLVTAGLVLRAKVITANTTSNANASTSSNANNATSNGRITSISGEGNARIDYRNAVGIAPRIVYLRDTDTLWLAGGTINISHGNETITAKNSITYTRPQNTITALGHVQVTLADGRHIAGERVDAHLTQDGRAISRITMAGNVTLLDGVNVLTGAVANINLATGTAQLTTDGDTRVRGQFQP